MDDAAGDEAQLHIVVFPWLAFGHMAPFLELTKALAGRGHLISYLSTRKNIQRLPKIPPQLSPLITLVELTLPPTEGLPEGAESTMDLEVDKVQYLKMAFDGLEVQVAEFLEAASPAADWVVHDFAQNWMPRAAVPCAFFSVFSPWMNAFFGRPGEPDDYERGPWTTPRRWIPFAPWLVFRPHEAAGLDAVILPNATGISDFRRYMSAIEGCRVFVLRGLTAEEPDPAEADWLALIGELYGKPVLSVGGLLPPALLQERSVGSAVKGGGAGADPPGGADDVFFAWLGRQTAGSVVYVAFGSEAELSLEPIHKLAMGLEQSELPFIWALRKPPGSPDGADLLPPGFRERIGGRGIVTTEWVPQIRVLAHPSVGVFLTHSGWSSVIEGLAIGKPLALLPLYGDHCLIARAIAQRKAGMEIPRDEEDGGFTAEGVAAALRMLTAGDKAEAFRANARRAGQVFGDAAYGDRCVDDLIRCFRSRRPPPVA